MRYINFLSGALLVLLISACQPQTTNNSSGDTNQSNGEPIPVQNNVSKENKMPKKIELTGTVTYLNLEGGFFGIVTDKGDKLLPLNLAKQYHQDGAIISFTGETQKNELMTIQQWGTPFKIKSIKLIKKGKSNNSVEF